MSELRWLPWLMLAVWASWLAALQALFAGSWMPDLSLLLLVACAARFRVADVSKAALLLALARVAYSVEPPAAILAGFLAAAAAVRAVRSVAEVNGPLARALVAGASAWMLAGWFLVVHAVRGAESNDTAASAAFGSAFASSLGLWPLAFTTALTALLLGPAFALLPGLTPLRRRRW